MLRLTSAGLAEPSTQRKSRRANSSFQPAPSSQRLTSATPRRLTSSGAIECSKEQVAALASSSSVMCSSARHASYSSSSRGPKSSGSSELIVTGTPARSSAGSGCSSSDGTDRSSTFELGHTSRQIASRASLCTRGLSQKHSTPCATRRAPKSSTADRTESAPDTPPPGASSPACGNAASPAAAAIRNASAKGAGGLPGSAECRPKPTMPARPWTRCWPRETTPPTTVASRSALAAGSCLSAEKMYAHATRPPRESSAAAAASSSSSTVGSRPSKRSHHSCKLGATSTQRQPAASASSRSSRTMRKTSSRWRRHSHAARYALAKASKFEYILWRVSSGRVMPCFAHRSARVSVRIAPSRWMWSSHLGSSRSGRVIDTVIDTAQQCVWLQCVLQSADPLPGWRPG
mmetsp:Transcript_29263/g.94024  ORF Transcript_29263/g.94024 Transcript_29263/m.94024 type:complete len:404 (+) Transcript_29263:101-1312(+)